MSQVNVTKLDGELRTAGIPIDGVADLDGAKAHVRIDFQPSATAAQRTQAAQILATHDPTDTAQQARLAALVQAKTDAQGVTLDIASPSLDLATLAAEIVKLKKVVRLLIAQLDVVKHGDPSQ